MPSPTTELPATASSSASASTPLTVRQLRRRWKPTKERLLAKTENHPTSVRVHRALSWLARVEAMSLPEDVDMALLSQWVAFNALYGQWNARQREPMPDRAGWKRFLERVLPLDASQHLRRTLEAHRPKVLKLLGNEHLSGAYWQEPTPRGAQRSRRPQAEAVSWYFEARWLVLLEALMERIYLLRCQLSHGAATYGGRLNRDALTTCSEMLGHLLQAILLAVIDHGADEDWGELCYPPLAELPLAKPRPR